MKLRKAKKLQYWKTLRREVVLIGEGERYMRKSVLLRRKGNGYTHGADAEPADFASVPADVVAAYRSPFGGLYAVGSAGLYAMRQGQTGFSFVADLPAGTPFFVDVYENGAAVTVLFCGKTRTVFSDGDTRTVEARYAFRAGTPHCGRFFGADADDPFRLRWSAGGALDWTTGICGSGYIDLPAEGGEILRLFSMDDRLIAVRQTGITVVRAYGEPQHFKVDATAGYMTAGGVVADTCAMCAGGLYFCTGDGLYRFNGSAVERAEREDGREIVSPHFAAAYGDKYFVACADESARNVLYVYDASEKSGYDMDVSPTALCAGVDGAYAFCPSAIYRLCSANGQTRGYWYSADVDFGSRAPKYLREVSIEGSGDVQLTVTGGDSVRAFSGAGRYSVGMAAQSFAFVASTYGDIGRLTAVVEVRDGI